MPKKKNFLGGQQNYNPNNGQYEPALKGPNGESPSGFSSFKKAESKDKNESFDAINEKRMYGEKQFSNQNNEERLKEGGLKGSFERAGFKVSEVTDKSMVIDDRFKIIENENAGFDVYDGEEKIAEDIGNQKDFVEFIKKYKDENNSFEKVNAKRMGKEQPKSEETQEDKDFNAEIKKTADDIRSSGDRYTYMMLDRLRSDVEYVLGNGGKGAMNQLWYNGDPKKHIALMRELHRGLKEKPQWLPYDKIAEYEKKLKELK